jgi:hypothetical protein
MGNSSRLPYFLFPVIFISLVTVPVGAGIGAETMPNSSAVSGHVTFGGVIPDRVEPILAYRDSQICGESMLDESLLIQPNSKGLKNVVVSIEGVSVARVNAPQEVVIESDHCHFVPRTVAGMHGSTLRFRNRDPILHDTQLVRPHSLKPIEVNVLQRAGAADVVKSVYGPGMMQLRCNLHPFMRGSVHIFDHPYFAVTDETGQYYIPDVPPGTYRLQFWHETLGEMQKIISIKQGEPATVDMTLAP